jgi:hypothetical protein
VASTEEWIILRNGKLFLHVENDGPRALRHGIEACEYEVTLGQLREWPRLLKEAMELLGAAGYDAAAHRS